ncbi:hypothetical protein E1211_15360 [Micromonospora sp. 15K316]|uniref:hypothetical protein n=1 Tax=Micromonospora sp. 15K316 TaxID=2530376 RepID=UPI001051BC05|nr:hypothetical protein [Micromonospora sp. 15K316]TDC35681.1 hypothetical protein E1211_15360 [Micromonospora sp. 15K316]
MLRDLLDAAGPLASIGAGVALLFILGRDRDGRADEHDVSDYRPEPGSRLLSPSDDLAAYFTPPRRRYRLRPGAAAALDVLPPAPPGTTARLSIYAEQVVAELMRERYGTTNPGAIAGGMLREIATEEQAAAGIRPAVMAVA